MMPDAADRSGRASDVEVDHKPSIGRRATLAAETPCVAHRGQVSPEAIVDACILNGCLRASWGVWGDENGRALLWDKTRPPHFATKGVISWQP